MLARILLATAFFLTSCATNYNRVNTHIDKVKPTLSVTNSFAFFYNGSQYYFAPNFFKQDGRECYLYLGFKNGELKYAFSNHVFWDIKKVYKQNSTPEKIKKLIVDRVEHENPTEKRCHELGSGPPPDAGQGIGIIIFAFPLVLPIAIAQLAQEQMEPNLIGRIATELYLGIPFKEMPLWLTGAWVKKTKGRYTYYELTEDKSFAIFYFEDGVLNAWSIGRN